MIIIPRTEAQEINNLPKWALVYGRRKTGKTFLVQKFVKFDNFFFVNRDGSIFSEKLGKMSVDTLIALIRSNEGILVIDEFQRLGENFLDVLQRIPKTGKLILISSTLAINKTLLTQKSPILGFFAEYIIKIFDLASVLKRLDIPDPITKLEMAILLREPLANEFITEDARKSFVTTLKRSLITIPGLLGEIFTEEERLLSKIYDGIMRSVANGKQISSELASYLYSNKALKKDDPSLVQPYLNILVELGILKKIMDLKRNRFYYYHISPLVDFYYYLDEKYGIANREIPEEELARVLDTYMPHLVERNIREALAKKYGLHETILKGAKFDVDGILVRYKTPEIAMEIKWRKKISKKNFMKGCQNLDQIECKKKLFIMQKYPEFNWKALIDEQLEVLEAKDLMELLEG